MSTPVIAKGHRTIIGAKLNTNPWGSGAAVAVGAANGIEADGHSLKPNVTLIENDALGAFQRFPGAKGDELYGGEFGPCPLYYAGLDLPWALGHGVAGAPTNLGSGAYKHIWKLTHDHADKNMTLVTDVFGNTANTPIWEFPHVKVRGWRLEAEHNQLAKITFMCIPSVLNFNTGSPDDDFVVVAVEPANGALTIADGTPDNPTPISVTVTDANTSITELVLTIVGTDRDDNQITEVYTLSTDGLTFTTQQYFKSVTSATISGLAGTATGDTIKVGITNGVNNHATIGSITNPTDRNLVLFSQISSFLINAQTGGALSAADDDSDNDEYYISKVMVEVNLGHNEGDVTTKFRYWTEEPVTGGEGFPEITLGFNFSKYDSRNHEHLKRLISKGQQKAKLTFTGPVIGGGIPYSLTMYFNGLQIEGDSPAPGGPGILPFDVTAKAHKVVTVPTGFPANYSDAVTTELVNTTNDDPLS